jgi:hypothetical protein
MLDYLRKFLDPTDPTGSLKHAAYALVICASCFWLSADLFMKEAGGAKRGIDANWVAAFGLLLGAVTTAKAFSRDENKPNP